MTGSYRRGYSSNRSRAQARPTPGRVRKPNRRPGTCVSCELEIPAFGGDLWRNADGTWTVVHHERTPAPTGPWDRAPLVGGCPDATDRENARLFAGGFIVEPTETEQQRIERTALALAAAAAPAGRPDNYPGRNRAYTTTGARLSSRYGRCEDAPCCGCCD